MTVDMTPFKGQHNHPDHFNLWLSDFDLWLSDFNLWLSDFDLWLSDGYY